MLLCFARRGGPLTHFLEPLAMYSRREPIAMPARLWSVMKLPAQHAACAMRRPGGQSGALELVQLRRVITEGELRPIGGRDVSPIAAHNAAMDENNGILPTIPGNYIAAAVLQCPAPRTAQADVHEVVIDAGWAGRVRITCRLAKSRKFWTAIRADRVEA